MILARTSVWEFKVDHRKLLKAMRAKGFCYRCCKRLDENRKCPHCQAQFRAKRLEKKMMRERRRRRTWKGHRR
jgi:hypothetical protein